MVGPPVDAVRCSEAGAATQAARPCWPAPCALFRRHLGQAGERLGERGLVIVAVFELDGEVVGIGLHVEMAVARQVEQDGARLALGLAASASSMAQRTAWVDSGAGTMPSVRANCTPASKQASCW